MPSLRLWLICKFLEFVENNREILIMFGKLAADCRELPVEILIRFQHLPQLNECPHDHNVDLNCTLAVQYARKHRHALLSESVGSVRRPPLPLFEIANCDIKEAASFLFN